MIAVVGLLALTILVAASLFAWGYFRTRKHAARDGARYRLAPVGIRWRKGGALHFLDWHGWQIGSERIDGRDDGAPLVPGEPFPWRPVFGWTLHVGALKVCFGPAR